MRLALVLAFVAAPAVAQTTGVVTLTAGDLSGLGYTRPHYSVGVGLERETRLFSFAGTVSWSPSDKERVRILTPPIAPAWNATARVEALVKLGPALVGGGGSASITRESDYTKDAARPHVTAGAEFPLDGLRLRVLGSHLWSGSDESNHLRGERVSLRAEIPQGNWRHRIGFEVGFYRFHESGNPDGPQYARRTWALSIGECF